MCQGNRQESQEQGAQGRRQAFLQFRQFAWRLGFPKFGAIFCLAFQFARFIFRTVDANSVFGKFTDDEIVFSRYALIPLSFMKNDKVLTQLVFLQLSLFGQHNANTIPLSALYENVMQEVIIFCKLLCV